MSESEPRPHPSAMFAGIDAVAARLDADELDGIVDERMEGADGVGAATDAGDDGIREPAVLRRELRLRLDADDALELAHHQGERVRPDDGPRRSPTPPIACGA